MKSLGLYFAYFSFFISFYCSFFLLHFIIELICKRWWEGVVTSSFFVGSESSSILHTLALFFIMSHCSPSGLLLISQTCYFFELAFPYVWNAVIPYGYITRFCLFLFNSFIFLLWFPLLLCLLGLSGQWGDGECPCSILGLWQ
jgi:hypothetical protein